MKRSLLTHPPSGDFAEKTRFEASRAVLWSLSCYKELKLTTKLITGCTIRGLLIQMQDVSVWSSGMGGKQNFALTSHRARSIRPKFQPIRPGKEDHLKRWTRFFETFPVGPNRSIEFCTEISRKFGWMDCAHRLLPSYFAFLASFVFSCLAFQRLHFGGKSFYLVIFLIYFLLSFILFNFLAM